MSQQETKDRAKYFYRASAADFMKIPGSPVAYWLSDTVLGAFAKGQFISSKCSTRKGMATGLNAEFVRSWYEISIIKIGFGLSRSEAKESGFRWFPYANGGEYRKWYGNYDDVVNWENDGHRLQTEEHESGRIRAVNLNLDFIFKQGLSWTSITSGAFSIRLLPKGFLFSSASNAMFGQIDLNFYMGLLNSQAHVLLGKALNPTLNANPGDIGKIPLPDRIGEVTTTISAIIDISKRDWDSYETSWDFATLPLLNMQPPESVLRSSFHRLRGQWDAMILDMQTLEQENNASFIKAYGLDQEILPYVPLEEITLTCNPHYRYGEKRSEQERETQLQCDTLRELISYAIGCMMGRYSLDNPGLILASQGETLQDYLRDIPSPRFAPDDDGILPLTDQEWFADDATNRFREFVRVVWGDEHLQENLDFVAESLCLHAIKPKRGESALDTIRRYLSNQFFKDHLRTYKKRPIYWLFSSGKHKAFECLVYLHRYSEGTLARMRTEYVIPLSAKLNAYAGKLEQDKEASTSTAETKRLEKEVATLHKQQAELAEFDEKLRHYADQRISLDLDDGVKVNYGKFGDLLAEVKVITGESPR